MSELILQDYYANHVKAGIQQWILSPSITGDLRDLFVTLYQELTPENAMQTYIRYNHICDLYVTYQLKYAQYTGAPSEFTKALEIPVKILSGLAVLCGAIYLFR